MPRVNYVKKARKPDKEYGIKKGQSYYWWKFPYGAKIKSKTKPRRQQLTRSGYQIALYDIEDIKNNMMPAHGADYIRDDLENIKQMVSDLQDECKKSLENMPEQLQKTSAAGCVLTERIELLECYYVDLDNIAIDEDDVDNDTSINDYLQEKIDEIQGCEPYY